MLRKIKALCMITQNEQGFHKVTYDKHTTAWSGLPNASGTLIKETWIKRPRSERGKLCYEFLGEEAPE